MLRLTQISEFIQRNFPEREFHYRAGGAVRYFRLTTQTQVAAAGAVTVVLLWTLGLSIWAVGGSGSSIENARLEQRLAETRAAVARAEAQKAALNRRLATLKKQSQKSQDELRRSRSDFASAAALGTALKPKPLKPVLSVPAQSRLLALGIPQQGADRTATKTSRPKTVFDTLKPSEKNAIGSGIEAVGFNIAGIRARNRNLLAERDKLWNRVAYLRAGLDRMRSGRAVLLTRLDRRTQRNIDEIERVIVMTGLVPKDLLSRLNTDGKGGPAIAVPAAVEGTDAYAVRVVRLTQRLQKWEKLQAILRSMPLIAPLDHYRKSSGFGKRRDPITGRWSSHNGLDFAYHRNTPVLSTAGGKVTFAGWRGGYGWMIEIDHGMGIRTRYAHLKKILVEKGQKLAFREKIGLLGSSGRSSGPHVHYEVVVDGRPRNPMKFITAGKYVFKR